MASLNFKGKSIIQNYHLAVKYHELVPDKEKSLTDKVSLNDNLIIHGDNLKALKALLPTYAGKIKCIYIDPPYNTGNEGWKYNDNVNSPMMQEWLDKTVDKDDLTRHDKWLCMMMPRLKLLRDLLSDNGAIFISIDDNEFANLKLICDEIFGEDNNVANIVVQSNPRGKQQMKVALTHEYLLIYANDIENITFTNQLLSSEQIKEYNKIDDNGLKYREIGLRKRGAAARRVDVPNLYYPIYVNPNNGQVSLNKTNIFSAEATPVLSNGEEGRWRWGKKKFEENCSKLIGRIVNLNRWDIFEKDFLTPEKSTKFKSVWIDKELNYENAKKELDEILGENITFEYPKTTYLLKCILRLACSPNDIVLDSFAGSGTTAHAVLDLNKEDGGNRKFILVECEDYADSITAERVRRVIKGVPEAKDEKLKNGLGGSFSYFELGNSIEVESILEGEKLPSFMDLARYIFYTATGEEFIPEKVDEDKHFIGESKEYEVYLFYKPDIAYLKATALTLDSAKELGEYNGKKKLVFAPTKYLDLADGELLAKHGIKGLEYCQLPFEIYRLKG